jgi:hypothetical protein
MLNRKKILINNFLITSLFALTISIIFIDSRFIRAGIFLNILLMGFIKWEKEDREPGLRLLKKFKSRLAVHL